MPDDRADDPEEAREGAGPPAPVSGAEWATAAVGAALVLAVVGQLVREAVRDPRRPPDVTVTADSVTGGRGGFVVHFTARNGGDETAADLTVRATLAAPGDTVEREATVDYLPGRSDRGGGLVFPRDPRDPRAGTLRVEAVGYREP